MQIELKSLPPGEVAKMYGISVHRLNRWLKPFKKELTRPKGTYNYTSAQVKVIFDKLGAPLDYYEL